MKKQNEKLQFYRKYKNPETEFPSSHPTIAWQSNEEYTQVLSNIHLDPNYHKRPSKEVMNRIFDYVAAVEVTDSPLIGKTKHINN